MSNESEKEILICVNSILEPIKPYEHLVTKEQLWLWYKWASVIGQIKWIRINLDALADYFAFLKNLWK